MDKSYILNTKLNENQAALFYLGQEGYLIKYQDKYIVIDPYLSYYVDENCCSETVKWVRNYPSPIEASELDFVDYVLLTHEHYDHADPATLSTIAKCNSKAKFIAPEPIKNTILTYGISSDRMIGAIADEVIDLDGCKVIPVPSAHEELRQDENGNYMDMGYRVVCGDISIYHAGDCCLYDGLTERVMNVDMLMVPINGRSYYKLRDDIIGNMTIEEALILAKEANAGMIVPMHYDLYPINCVNPAHFVDMLYTTNPELKFHMFVPGERYIIQK